MIAATIGLNLLLELKYVFQKIKLLRVSSLTFDYENIQTVTQSYRYHSRLYFVKNAINYK